jgi:hypothetical protein
MTLFAIIIFVILFFGTIMFKPSFLYQKDGSLRKFGVGYKQKTILPLWLYAILLGISSYLIIVFYVSNTKLKLDF